MHTYFANDACYVTENWNVSADSAMRPKVVEEYLQPRSSPP